MKRAFVSLMLLMSSLICSACGSLYLGAGTSGNRLPHAPSEAPVTAADCAREPVVVVPGIMGSTLFDPKYEMRVWGAFKGNYARPGTPEGLQTMALPMAKTVPLNELQDQVVADGLLQTLDFKLLGLIPAHAEGYRHVVEDLRAVGYRVAPPGHSQPSSFYNAFVFTYDWRRDLVETARLFHDFILEKKAVLARHYAACPRPMGQPITFHVMAHSMGGLIVQYYLRYGNADLPSDGTLPPLTWQGSAHIHKATLLAPPNEGSLRALQSLLEGRVYLPGTDPYPKAVIGTFPSVYMLLPHEGSRQVVHAEDTTRALHALFDTDTWVHLQWGLSDPSEDAVLRILLPDVPTRAERAAIAHDHLRKCLTRAHHFSTAIDQPARAPEGLRLHLILGEEIPTDARMAVDLTTGSYRIIAQRPGDGRVLRASALGRDTATTQWSEVSITTGRHMHLLQTARLAHQMGGMPSASARTWQPMYRLSAGLAVPVSGEEHLGRPTQKLGLRMQGTALWPLSSWLKTGVSLAYWRFANPDLDHLGAGARTGGDTIIGGQSYYVDVSIPLEVHPQSHGFLTPFAGIATGAMLHHQNEVEIASYDGPVPTPIVPEARTLGFYLTGTLGLRYALTSTLDLVTQTRFNLLALRGAPTGEIPRAPLQIGISFRY